MTYKIVRQTPARGDQPARDIPAGCNILDKNDAEKIAAKLEDWASTYDAAKFIVVEEEKPDNG
jgi:hypothetical protein